MCGKQQKHVASATLLTNYFQFLWKVKECVVVVQEKLSKKSNDFVGSFGGAESIYLLNP
jgi:hypothetical protein